MSDEKSCESCGMPMRQASDFGAGRPDNAYCVHCTDEQGQLKPYQEVLENLKNFAIKNMGISEAEALKMAQQGLSRQPAWQKGKN